MSITVVASTNAYASGAPTFGKAKSEIAAFVQAADDADVLNQAGDYYNEGIRRLINARDWIKYCHGSQIISLGEGDAYYSLKRNIRGIRAAEFWDPSEQPAGRCEFKAPKTFQSEHQKYDGNGSPCVYTIYEQDRILALNVPPSQSFINDKPTLALTVHIRVGQLQGNGDVLQAPPEFHDLCLWYGMWRMAVMRAPSKTIDAERQWSRQLRDLLVADNETTDWSEVS